MKEGHLNNLSSRKKWQVHIKFYSEIKIFTCMQTGLHTRFQVNMHILLVFEEISCYLEYKLWVKNKMEMKEKYFESKALFKTVLDLLLEVKNMQTSAMNETQAVVTTH